MLEKISKKSRVTLEQIFEQEICFRDENFGDFFDLCSELEEHFGKEVTFQNFRFPDLQEWFVDNYSKLHGVSIDPNLNLSEFLKSDQTPIVFDSWKWEFNSAGFIVLTSFYFGEVFIKQFPELKWDIGTEDFADSGRPVIKGFKFDLEMSVIDVTQNIFREFLNDPLEGESRLIRAISGWAERTKRGTALSE